MKKTTFILVVIFIFYTAYSQKGKDSLNRIYYSVYSENDFNVKNYDFDTSIYNLQIYNPAYSHSISNSFLGNTGSPTISNIYSKRLNVSEFIFINPLIQYMETPLNNRYYFTYRPLTMVNYIEGGSSIKKEEILNVLHTQNASAKYNFGFNFNFISSLGNYRYQKVKKNSFKFFNSYNGDIYSFHGNICINKYEIHENGGVVNDYYITDSTISRSNDIPTIYSGLGTSTKPVPDVMSGFRNLHIYFSQNWNLGNLLSKADSFGKIENKDIFKFMHVIEFESNKKIFIDKDINAGLNSDLIDNLYFNTKETHDSVAFRRISNSFRIRVKDFIKAKFNYDLYADFTNDLYKNCFYSADTLMNEYKIDKKKYIPFFYKEYFYSNSFGAGISTSIKNRFGWNASGKYILNGYKSGSLILNGNLFFVPSKKETSRLDISGEISFVEPNYYLEKYYSNNFFWQNNFLPEEKVELSINYSHLPKKAKMFLNYSLIRNQIFIDTNASPNQYDKEKVLLIASGGVEKTFSFWKVRSLNNIIFQYVNNDKILSLPKICFYNSTYFEQLVKFNVTGGELKFLLGVDVYYNTEYYAYAYMPATIMFYNQYEKMLGNYPYLDAFLDVRIKRARFFIKYEHFNSDISGRNYFTILHYPRMVRTIKLGITWSFYY